MSYLLDTDVIIDFLRQNKEAVEKIAALNDVCKLNTTIINLCELYEGVYLSNQQSEQLRVLFNFMSSVDILTPDLDTALTFGLTKTMLKKKGKIIGDFDTLIASIAMTNNLILVTRNKKHYENIDGLKIESV
jgi:tRNA(fMet)-specific endonuclease VapC